jgi:hypothetical protein
MVEQIAKLSSSLAIKNRTENSRKISHSILPMGDLSQVLYSSEHG